VDTGRTIEQSPTLLDRFGRPLRDLRVSVTDRCNFRCRYCMPREVFGPGFEYLPRSEILSFEEITRLARIFAALGVRKLRLTGGEPTLRADLPVLIEMLTTIPDLEITLTTNGSHLKHQAQSLADAGLRRVTVSLDSLDDAVFRSMNDMDFPVHLVLEGIEAADRAGLRPIKVNAVVRRGVNEHTVLDLARHFKGSGHILRFIEYMDVGNTNGWRLDEVVPGHEVVARISEDLPLIPLDASYRGEVAQRWAYADGSGEVGVITSVTEPFCGDCTRARLTASGELVTCLFATHGLDLRERLRDGSSDTDIEAVVRDVWSQRDDRYSELRSEATATLQPLEVRPRLEMSRLGG
jgi:cyclic pyranopterin phosphate synthase